MKVKPKYPDVHVAVDDLYPYDAWWLAIHRTERTMRAAGKDTTGFRHHSGGDATRGDVWAAIARWVTIVPSAPHGPMPAHLLAYYRPGDHK